MEAISQKRVEDLFKEDFETKIVGSWSYQRRASLHFMPTEIEVPNDGTRIFEIAEYPNGYYMTTDYQNKKGFVHFNDNKFEIKFIKKDKPRTMVLITSDGKENFYEEII